MEVRPCASAPASAPGGGCPYGHPAARAILACSPSSFRHSFSRMESLADQRRQLVANQWSRTPRDLQVQILRSPPSAPSRPATVIASSRPRDPRRARTPWGFGPEQVVFYGRGRLGRRWFPKPVQTGSIPVVRAILALSNGNDAALPGRRCGSDSRRGVHLSGSSNGRMPVYETGDDGSNPSLATKNGLTKVVKSRFPIFLKKRFDELKSSSYL